MGKYVGSGKHSFDQIHCSEMEDYFLLDQNNIYDTQGDKFQTHGEQRKGKYRGGSNGR